MSDNITPQSSSQNPQTPELMIQAANAVSYSLLYSLSRQYLDIPIEEANHFQSIRKEVPELFLQDFFFLHLEQVGSSPSDESLHHPFTALQTALTSCHAPGRYTLVFIISNDGKQNDIYLGVRSNDDNFSPQDFTKNLGNFLQGNWKGTKLRPCHPDTNANFKEKVLNPLNTTIGFGTALTGIPSLKTKDVEAYPQTLDRLISGLRGHPFTYMVIAEPMDRGEIDEIIFTLRNLMGQVHTLGKLSVTKTFTESISEALSTSKGKSWQETNSKNQGETKDNKWIEKGLIATDVVATAAGLMLGASNPLTLPLIIVGALASGNKFFFTPTQKTSGTGTSTANGTNENKTETTTTSTSNAIAYGQEYISSHAQATEELIKQYIERFEQARALGCWNVGVYLLAEESNIAQHGGMQLSSLLSGEKSFLEPVRVHDLKSVWIKQKVRDSVKSLVQPTLDLVVPESSESPNILNFPKPGTPLNHPLGKAFNSLTTPLNTKELALLVNLPQREVSGVKVMPTADFSLNPSAVENDGIILGKILEGGEPTQLDYKLSLKSLSKHGLISGITGSGKSTTGLRLLKELNEQQIPFLIIEPAKEEYVEWAIKFNASLAPNDPRRIAVYIPGVQTWRGHKLEQLILNPLDFIWLDRNSEPHLLSHIDRLKSILTAAFPMYEVLPIALEDTLFHTYTHQKWLANDISSLFDSPRPTLSNLLDAVSVVVRSKGYEERITQNITAALKTRITSLCRGWKQQLFDQPRSTAWQDIFDRPVLINLSHLGDDADKAFTMSILLQFLYEYRQAQQELQLNSDEQTSQGLNHLTVIEEAHRILLKPINSGGEQANPQGKVAEMFANILSEIRAYGEGLLIVDQMPSRLIPDAIKNTNLKIVHRLVAADDREAMSASMGLTPQQSAIINRLKPGQAIVYADLDDMATWIEVFDKYIQEKEINL